MFAVGLNDFGQCSIPKQCQGYVLSVSAGYNHTLVLLQNYKLIAVGCNVFRQSQVPKNFESKVVKVSTSLFHSLALTESG